MLELLNCYKQIKNNTNISYGKFAEVSLKVSQPLEKLWFPYGWKLLRHFRITNDYLFIAKEHLHNTVTEFDFRRISDTTLIIIGGL